MGVSRTYRKSRENNIASFDYVDLANGTGVEIYFGTQTSNSSETKQELITQRQYPANVQIVQSGTGDTTFDFDLTPYNLPRTVTGEVLFSCGTDVSQSTGTVGVTVMKWDGTSETAISDEVISGNILGNQNGIELLMRIPVTETNFKRGETLRMAVRLISITSAILYVGTDSMQQVNANLGNAATTEMTFHVPYKINQ